MAGFLLLEVLTALLIAALTLAVLTRSATESRNALHVALKNEEAVVRARSRLAALDHVGLLPDSAGDDGGGFTWITKVVPLATSAAMNVVAALVCQALRLMILYAVTVIIDWPEADIVHRFVLPTERIGSALQECRTLSRATGFTLLWKSWRPSLCLD